MCWHRQARCWPIHENSPIFGNSWSIWYPQQPVCVMSSSVHHMSFDRYLVTKEKALGTKMLYRWCWLLTKTGPILEQPFTNMWRYITDAIMTSCWLICQLTLNQYSTDSIMLLGQYIDQHLTHKYTQTT